MAIESYKCNYLLHGIDQMKLAPSSETKKINKFAWHKTFLIDNILYFIQVHWSDLKPKKQK